MPDIKEIDIERQKKADHPSDVYLIYGDDRYRKDISVRKLTGWLYPKLMPDANYRRFVGERDEMKAVREACLQMPMLDARCLVVMEDFPLDKTESRDMALLKEAVEALSGQCVLIIWQNDAGFDTRKSAPGEILKLVRVKGSALRLDIPTVNETSRTLCELSEQKGSRLSMADANYMVKRCGRDMLLLTSELEKLTVYAGRKNITREMIDEICPASLEADVYHISKNILWGRTGDALRVMDSLMLQGSKPVEIFTVLSQSFIDLYRAKCASLAGKGADDLIKEFASDYPRSRAFRAENAMRDQKQYSLMQLRTYIELLIGAELKLKGGRCDRKTCLEQLIVRLCYVKRGGARA